MKNKYPTLLFFSIQTLFFLFLSGCSTINFCSKNTQQTNKTPANEKSYKKNETKFLIEDSQSIQLTAKYYTNIYSKTSAQPMSAVFPSEVRINIQFLSTWPNKEIYLGKDKLLNEFTDEKGNADISGKYIEPGLYTIALKKKNKLFSEYSMNLNKSSTIICRGRKLLCIFYD